MKKIVFNFCFFIFAVVLAFTFHFKPRESKIGSAVNEGGQDIDGYYEWEQQRLADPSTGRIPDNIRNIELSFASQLPNDLLDTRDKHNLSSSGLWQMRGPWNIGGRTRAFAADVQNEGTLLAGTVAGGMWRSTDSGKTWTLTTQLAIQQSVSCLAQDTRGGHSNIWYYGSGECVDASASAAGAYYCGNGVYRSLDNGATWSSLTSTATNDVEYISNWEGIWNIATDPTAPDSLSTVYAALLNGGIYRSTDTGETWTAIFGSSRSTSGYFTNIIVTSAGVVYATISSDGAQRGIWRSTDGINFTNITPLNFPPSYNRIVICYAPTDPNQLYFLANTPGYGTPDTNFLKQVEWNSLWKYKYLSSDGDSAGGAWWDLSANLPQTGGLFDKYNCQGSYDMVVSFLPTDTSTVFIGGTDIFRSSSGFFDANHSAHIGGYAVGASFPNVEQYPGSHPDQHVIFFSQSNPLIMYNGSDGGLFKTLNDTSGNVSWTTLDSGYITAMMFTITSNHATAGSPILLAGLQDNNCIFDNSHSLTNSWTKPFSGDGSFCSIADTGKLFYYENTSGRLFKSQMDTVTGVLGAFNRIDPIGAKNYEWLNPYVIDPNNNNLMYLGGGKYLWKNTDLSAIPLSNMWDSISTNWVEWTDSVPYANANITAIAVSTNPANRVYFGTSDKKVYRIDSANAGTPVPRDITGSGFPSGEINGAYPYVDCIAVDPDNADNLIVLFSNYGANNLFYSSNGGTSWTNSSGNLDGPNQPSLRWVSIQHLSTGGTIYWIAASTGLYATDTLNGRLTVWVEQATGIIGNAVCDMVDVRQSDGLVAVATHSHGAYTANITSLNDITTVHNLNPVLANRQVDLYPNPSSGRADISYYLAENESVQVRIYNETGKLMYESALRNVRAGENIIPVDISGQSSGIYFCSLVTSESTKTIRMLVVK